MRAGGEGAPEEEQARSLSQGPSGLVEGPATRGQADVRGQ